MKNHKIMRFSKIIIQIANYSLDYMKKKILSFIYLFIFYIIYITYITLLVTIRMQIVNKN